mmetsp:Transcript_14678/g.41758  ORF Transcript_14678/g.41758 Transcript_14678/m.41758 type:complete len:213 (+) Transcript_14678:387-1025(+)
MNLESTSRSCISPRMSHQSTTWLDSSSGTLNHGPNISIVYRSSRIALRRSCIASGISRAPKSTSPAPGWPLGGRPSTSLCHAGCSSTLAYRGKVTSGAADSTSRQAALPASSAGSCSSASILRRRRPARLASMWSRALASSAFRRLVRPARMASSALASFFPMPSALRAASPRFLCITSRSRTRPIFFSTSVRWSSSLPSFPGFPVSAIMAP